MTEEAIIIIIIFKYIRHWLSPLFYMETKLGPLEKKDRNDLHQFGLNFSEEQPGTRFLTPKEWRNFGRVESRTI
jgi:hypothetical protein